MDNQYKVGVIGTGFVGTAVSTGLQTILGNKIEVREYDKFKDTESLEEVVENSDIIFLCLPTPMNEDGSCNVSILKNVVRQISNITNEEKLLVIKSTVPPGTTESLSQQYEGLDFCFNPEFLTQAKFIEDFINQDRIFLGWPSKPAKYTSFKKIMNLYKDFMECRDKQKKIETTFWSGSSKSVEMAKYIGNCFLTTKVIFFNEMYEICKNSGIDYEQTMSLVKSDKRIGSSHMQVPGPDGLMGAGGPCFPKDMNALIAYAKECGVDPLILESIWAKNLLIREEHEWENLAQVNGQYGKK